jgi:hypothetical protein
MLILMKRPSTECVPNNLEIFGYSSHEGNENRRKWCSISIRKILTLLFVHNRHNKTYLSPLKIRFHFVDELISSLAYNFGPSIFMRIMMGFGRQMATGVSKFHAQLCGQS